LEKREGLEKEKGGFVMKRRLMIIGMVFMLAMVCPKIHGAIGKDTIQTSQGPLEVSLLGHACLMFQFNQKVVYVDPVSKMADYSKLPKADLILVTHEHFDHLDPSAIKSVRKEDTVVVSNNAAAKEIESATVMNNGETKSAGGIKIEAVPAYNQVHMRSEGKPFHPKGNGNGYILTFGDKRIYVAGDTENIPEMKALKEIDAAFLPINLPYTMSARMVADAVKAFKPTLLYPYHYDMGESDLPNLEDAMKGVQGVRVRVPKRD
jgi:L-ascorbate metabolism protein UlaG (beta-lactamase superfamily)